MSNLDIGFVMFAMMIDLVLFTMAMFQSKKKGRIFYFLSMTFGISFIGYFMADYSGITIGNATMPTGLFVISWVFLAILPPTLMLIRNSHR